MASQDVVDAVGAGNGPSDERANSQSTTATTTINGQHEHTIVGYGLIKGIGDGEPIASERFTVGGHEWVLLFYPDGKRSSSSEGHLANQPPARMPNVAPHPPPAQGGGGAAQPPGPGPPPGAPAGAVPRLPPPLAGPEGEAAEAMYNVNGPMMQHPAQHHAFHGANIAPRPMREATNDYAALFVALIGEGPDPQGVVNTSEGKVVRAFHRFTLVDQSPKDGEAPRHLTKGRRRDQGAVKISCARQDPNARNCHGYRKFVKRSVLENPANGYLKDDTIIIRYAIELVVSSGGALSRNATNPGSSGFQGGVSGSSICVPSPSLGLDMSGLLDRAEGSDVTFKVEDEIFRGHKIVLTSRSPVFRALLSSGMREAEAGEVSIQDVRPPVFKALLHFVYSDSLPSEHEGPNLDVHMAQHLLVAADKFELGRLRAICEQRLCETVDEASVATTLTLAEQNHAGELKRVCLEYISSSDKLTDVMSSEGFQHMVASCPHLQVEILQYIATRRRQQGPSVGHSDRHGDRHGGILRSDGGGLVLRGQPRGRDTSDLNDDGGLRRVRQRRE